MKRTLPIPPDGPLDAETEATIATMVRAFDLLMADPDATFDECLDVAIAEELDEQG